MKGTLLNLIRLSAKTFIIICTALSAYAQKTDDVQAESVWTSNVKVDGQMTEWTGPLQASNKSTGLSYTLANDDKNLYLVVRSTDMAIINKIMLGGISLTVNTDGKKRVKDGYTLTYPVVSRRNLEQAVRAGVRGQGGAQPGQFSSQRRDSMQMVQKKAMLASAKDIKVYGFKDITDSLISIYNTNGIKAFASIDQKGVYVSEFAIPLSSMKLSIDKPKEFSYNIKVNGLQLGGLGDRQGNRPGGASAGGGGAPGGGGPGGGGGRSGAGAGGIGGGGSSPGGIDRQAMMSPTDFWGKYTLTKQ